MEKWQEDLRLKVFYVDFFRDIEEIKKVIKLEEK